MSWYYLEKWYIDLHDGEEQPEREHRCDNGDFTKCEAYNQLGITACEGCAR